jgi:hypothetical protein
MNTHADKTQENKSQSVSNETSKKKSGGSSTFQFVDNRPETVAQLKLQEMANNSPQTKQATQLQAMANGYSAQQQQTIQKKGKVLQLNGEENEDQHESWGEWLWRHRWKFALAGVTIAAAYALYKSSNGGEPNLPEASGGGQPTPTPTTTLEPTTTTAAPTTTTAAPTTTTAAPTTTTPSSGVSGDSGESGKESIWMMSLRQTVFGPQEGDSAPPCPLDPVTGGPNFDAWGELIEKAIEPIIQKGLDAISGQEGYGKF